MTAAVDRDLHRELLVSFANWAHDLAESAAQRVRDYDALADGLPLVGDEMPVGSLPLMSFVRVAGEDWQLIELRGDRCRLVSDGGAVLWVDDDQVVSYTGDPIA